MVESANKVEYGSRVKLFAEVCNSFKDEQGSYLVPIPLVLDEISSSSSNGALWRKETSMTAN